jgi:peroxiredoxin
MSEKECIKAGIKAPDFALKDQNEKEFRLSDYVGKKIILSFHPLAWTAVCAKQMISLEKNYEKLNALDTIAVGISIDAVPSKKAWAKELKIKNTRLLSDFWPHGYVANLYRIFRENNGFSERANIIIDIDQSVNYIQLYNLPELPDIQEILHVLMTISDE